MYWEKKMKLLTLLSVLATLFVSATSFAIPTSGSNKNTPLKALASAWKKEQLLHAKERKHDIEIVYGGEDISRKPTTIAHLASA